jgi:hypothetical protein
MCVLCLGVLQWGHHDGHAGSVLKVGLLECKFDFDHIGAIHPLLGNNGLRAMQVASVLQFVLVRYIGLLGMLDLKE